MSIGDVVIKCFDTALCLLLLTVGCWGRSCWLYYCTTRWRE